jgi:OmpA-OmpF porin, OOP family
MATGEAFAQAPGTKDHPLVGRYEGARNVGYRAFEFDEVKVIDGPFDPESARAQKGTGFAAVEGKSFLIYYTLPAGRSPLEVVKTYTATLEAKGFVSLFACSSHDGSCLKSNEFGEAPQALGIALVNGSSAPKLAGSDVSSWFSLQGRYLLAKLDRPEGAVYVSLGVGEGPMGVAAVVQVVEAKSFKPGTIQGVKKE